jgi:hypothetical protein
VLTGGELTAGARPPDFELVLSAAAVCSGHDLEDVVSNSAAPGEGSSTLTVSVRDPAISRHWAAHGHHASSDLLIASWPTDPAAEADGIGTGNAARVTTLFAS